MVISVEQSPFDSSSPPTASGRQCEDVMRLSVSIPDGDVQFIDEYAREHAVESRSGVVQRALLLLRANELGQDYAAAWDEWESIEAEAWDVTAADGLSATG